MLHNVENDGTSIYLSATSTTIAIVKVETKTTTINQERSKNLKG